MADVYRTSEIRAIEEREPSRGDAQTLMERAGFAAAEIARRIVADNGRSILVLAGPGNNGGDAFVLARYLKEWWFKVIVVFAGAAGNLKPDAANALRLWRDAGGAVVPTLPAESDHSLIVDGIFGIGLQRDVSAIYLEWIEAINKQKAPVLSLDVPSGLHSDTGRVMGAAVRASHTVTFIALKPGLLTLDGPDHCGEIHVAGLGLPDLPRTQGQEISAEIFSDLMLARPRNSHKGMYGSVGILGGASGMVGAALLAGRAALYLGTGRVFLGLLSDDAAVDWRQPELMLRRANDLLKLDAISCFVVGPGLGKSAAGSHVLHSCLESEIPLVLDADALNLIGEDEGFKKQLCERDAPAVLTPHPAEAARLLATSTREIQDDRVASALELASRFNCCALLKGSGTICATPDGRYFINPTGNPGMASGGMGDVLSGMIGALIAQGAPAEQAMLAGVYLHGAAADRAVLLKKGPMGLTASDVIACAREELNSRRSSEQ